MTTFGVTPSGFAPKLIGDIEKDITTAMRANVDKNFDMSADEPIGQMGSIIANEAAQLWELGAAMYSGLNPNNAEGFILDGACAYTGTKRASARYSTVVATMNLNAAASVPAGSLANVSGQPTNLWLLLGPADPVTGLVVTPGPVVATTAGNYLGVFQAITSGPALANAGQLSVITAAVTGWNTVTNVSGCTLGAVIESDSALNIRRVSELASAGGSTVDAMRADLLNTTLVPGIVQAFVTENTGDVVDANGLPPHSMHIVVYDGIVPAASNASIAAVIWKDKGSGIQTIGAISAQTPDSQGVMRTVNFDRAVVVPYWASLSITTDATYDDVNGATAIASAMVLESNAVQNLGINVVALRLRAVALGIQGVTDVPVFTLGTSPSPAGTSNIPITGLQIAVLTDNTHVVVTDLS